MIGANYNVVTQNSAAATGKGGTPTFAHNKTWGSIGEMDQAFRKYNTEWANKYAGSFSGSGAEGNGKITQEELDELLQEEFGAMGVQFRDGVDPNNPKEGVFEVYIDQVNRQKMADDPSYRAKVFAVIQTEMAGANGYSVKTNAGVNTDRTTGLSMTIAEGNQLFEGVPHHAGGTSASGGVAMVNETVGSEGKSLLEEIRERMEKKLEEKKEKEKKEAAKQAREDMVELSVEATAAIKTRAAEKAEAAEEAGAIEAARERKDAKEAEGPAVGGEGETTGGGKVNVIA